MLPQSQIFYGPKIKKYESLPDTFVFVVDHIGTDYEKGGWEHFCDLLLARSKNSEPIGIEYVSADAIPAELQNHVIFLPAQPFYTAWTLKKMLGIGSWESKTSSFNFMINKDRPNRTWLVESLKKRNLRTDFYSLPWTDRDYGFEPRWFEREGMQRQGNTISNGSITNPLIYQQWLSKNVFEPTVVSLITEPDYASDSVFMSEKTVFAFESGTVPIWFGAGKYAEAFKQLGFDVFEDLIDHAYQHLLDPHEAMSAALDLNESVLRNKAQLLEFWVENRHRFIKNWELIRSCHWMNKLLVEQYNQKNVSSCLTQYITDEITPDLKY